MNVQVVLGVLGTLNQLVQFIAPIIADVKATAEAGDREAIDLELAKLRAAVDQQSERTQAKLRGNISDAAPS